MFFSYIPHGFLSLKSRLRIYLPIVWTYLSLWCYCWGIFWGNAPSAEHRESIKLWHRPSVNISLFSVDTTELQLFTLLLLNSACSAEREKSSSKRKIMGIWKHIHAVLPWNILSFLLFRLMTSFSQKLETYDSYPPMPVIINNKNHYFRSL